MSCFFFFLNRTHFSYLLPQCLLFPFLRFSSFLPSCSSCASRGWGLPARDFSLFPIPSSPPLPLLQSLASDILFIAFPGTFFLLFHPLPFFAIKRSYNFVFTCRCRLGQKVGASGGRGIGWWEVTSARFVSLNLLACFIFGF